MNFYKFQYSIRVPNSRYIVESARGTVTLKEAYFTSKDAFLFKLKQWSSQGWTYYQSDANKINNSIVQPKNYEITKKRNNNTGFSEHEIFWIVI